MNAARQGLWREAVRRLLEVRSQRWTLYVLAALLGAALLVPLASPHGYATPEWTRILRPPSPSAPFGTDGLGRDLLVRTMWGCRVSLLVGLVANYTGFLAPKVALFSNILLMVIVLLWRPQGLFPVVKR